MTIDSIKTVAVLGAGTMGNGIAHVFARAGSASFCATWRSAFCNAVWRRSAKNLDREVKKGKLTEAEKPAVLARLKPVTDMAAIAALISWWKRFPEKLEIKRAVLTEADHLLRPDVILASNTSSISITTLAAMTKRSDRFVGMHFMNPVPMMVLVEVIRALQTGDQAYCDNNGTRKKARENSGCRERRALALSPIACSCRLSMRRPTRLWKVSRLRKPSTRS